MPRYTVTQKTARVLKFLEATADPRITPPLAAVGYSSADLKEGWELLTRAGTVRLGQAPPAPATPRVREQLDAFENLWFPVVSASLKRRFPDVHEQVFLNLGQEEGAEVSLNVSIFLERIKGLSNHPLSSEIMTLLAKRGFTPAVIGEADALLAELLTVAPSPTPSLADIKKQHEAAIAEMWDWYLEWSTIARTVIHNRRHLRMLGFLADSGSSNSDEESESEENSVSRSGFPEADDDYAQIA